MSLTRSQSLSHSGGTSRQTSLRFVDGDVSRRPLVVSFRRPTHATHPKTCIHAAHCGCTRSNDLRRAIYTNRFEPKKITEETKFDHNSEVLLSRRSVKPTNIRKFRKWMRKNKDSNLYTADSNGYKVVCAECHKYLNKDIPSEEKKIVLVNNSAISKLSDSSCIVSEGFNSSSDNGKDCKCSPRESSKTLDTVPAEYDLIPRHRCPNQFQLDLQGRLLSSNSNISTNTRFKGEYVDRNKNTITSAVHHSKTMSDIVDYALQIKESLANDNCKPLNGLKDPLSTFNAFLIVEKPISRKDVLRQKIFDELGETRRKWGSVDNLFVK